MPGLQFRFGRRKPNKLIDSSNVEQLNEHPLPALPSPPAGSVHPASFRALVEQAPNNATRLGLQKQTLDHNRHSWYDLDLVPDTSPFAPVVSEPTVSSGASFFLLDTQPGPTSPSFPQSFSPRAVAPMPVYNNKYNPPSKGVALTELNVYDDSDSDGGSIQLSPAVPSSGPTFESSFIAPPQPARKSLYSNGHSPSNVDDNAYTEDQGKRTSIPSSINTASAGLTEASSLSSVGSVASTSINFRDNRRPMARNSTSFNDEYESSLGKPVPMPLGVPLSAGYVDVNNAPPTGPMVGTEPPRLEPYPNHSTTSLSASEENRRASRISRPQIVFERSPAPAEDPRRHSRAVSSGARTHVSSDGFDDTDDKSDDAARDILPFESTKAAAAQNRHSRALELPQISSGIVMSKDKFDTFRKSLARLDMVERNSSVRSHRNGDDEDEYSDDEIDVDKRTAEERRKKQAQARQQQNANLSVYRQKMTKMIGGGPVPGQETTTVDTVGADDEDEDDIMDDVPLSILRAHGFPKRAAPRRDSQLLQSPSQSPQSGHSPIMPTSQSGVAAFTSNDGLQDHSVPSLRPAVSMDSLNARSREQRASRIFGLNPSITPLPSVFGDPNKPVSKGLVAEIAREEDAKMQRRAGYMPFDRERSRLSLLQLNEAGADAGTLADMQQQLAQLSEMQSQIIKHMNGSPNMPHSQSYTPSMIQGRPMSVRSGWTPAQSMHRMSEPVHGFVPPVSPRMSMAYDRSDAMSTMGSPSPHAIAPRSSPLSSSNSSRSINGMPVGPSRIRPVPTADDEEDEDEEWAKLVQKRQVLRAQWRQAAQATSTV